MKISIKKKGFSLIEMLLVIAMAAVIFAFSTPFGMNFYRSQMTDDAQSNIMAALEKAKHNAILQKNDSKFGVYIVNGSYTIFQGNSYDGRVAEQDEVFPMISDISVSTTTVIFNKLTGLPEATSTINLAYENVSKSILVEVDGKIVATTTPSN